MRLISFVAAAALLSASFAARADTFQFTFGNSSSSFSGSGVLTTGTLQAPGQYLIASVTGTAETVPNGPGLVINFLTPGTFPTVTNGNLFPPNDNVLFVTAGIGSLDGNGLSFILSDGAQINLFNPNGFPNNALLFTTKGKAVSENVSTTITAVTATPEPSSFVLLGTGLLIVAGVAKHRFA